MIRGHPSLINYTVAAAAVLPCLVVNRILRRGNPLFQKQYLKDLSLHGLMESVVIFVVRSDDSSDASGERAALRTVPPGSSACDICTPGSERRRCAIGSS